MKKLYLLIGILLTVNGILMANRALGTADIESDVTLQDVESLSDSHESCWNGGLGSTSCSISAGLHAGFGFSEGCSVSCGEYYYACCEIRCYCVPYTPSF